MEELNKSQDTPKSPSNEDDFAQGAAATSPTKQGPRILEKMTNLKKGFGWPENENMQLKVGDWVTINDQLDALYMEHELRSKAPFAVARVEGTMAYVVSRKNYREGMSIPYKDTEGPISVTPEVGAYVISVDAVTVHRR